MKKTIQLNPELMHFGILGQKWGVRRYQNADGSLTPTGQKKVSSEYKKASVAGDKELVKNYNRLYFDAYNKSADKMNTGGIDKFNKQQEKKHGANYALRKGYDEDYEKTFNKVMSEEMDKTLYDFRASNSSYQKADTLVQKYNLTKWDDLAKSNEEVINSLRAKYG